jgi:hypothetical protein
MPEGEANDDSDVDDGDDHDLHVTSGQGSGLVALRQGLGGNDPMCSPRFLPPIDEGLHRSIQQKLHFV